jgi:hypothetical protein
VVLKEAGRCQDISNYPAGVMVLVLQKNGYGDTRTRGEMTSIFTSKNYYSVTENCYGVTDKR